MNVFAQRDPPFLTLLYHAVQKRPYEAFCEANGIYPIHNLPVILLRMNRPFDDLVTKNAFISPLLKGYMLDVYLDAKRAMLCLRRTVVRHARRRRRSQTTMDLSMCPFGSPSTRMDVFDKGKKYTFKVSDVLNLIHSSLTHSIEFICDPVAIKNPYTGLEFSNATLYSIYLMLRESAYAVPPLFVLFMGVNFNLDKFEAQYDNLLRDEIIKAHIENLSVSKRREEIRGMLAAVGVFNAITNRVEPIFRSVTVKPEELDQFKKWLHLYFLHLYSLNTYYSHIAFRALVKNMLRFRKENPTFGFVKAKRGI